MRSPMPARCLRLRTETGPRRSQRWHGIRLFRIPSAALLGTPWPVAAGLVASTGIDPRRANRSVQIPSIRTHDFQQSPKPMVTFEVWLGGPYGTEAPCQAGEVPSRRLTHDPVQKLKHRFGLGSGYRDRPELQSALDFLRKGDDTLVVWKLSRLAPPPSSNGAASRSRCCRGTSIRARPMEGSSST